jgi:hypothetical protein
MLLDFALLSFLLLLLDSSLAHDTTQRKTITSTVSIPVVVATETRKGPRPNDTPFEKTSTMNSLISTFTQTNTKGHNMKSSSLTYHITAFTTIYDCLSSIIDHETSTSTYLYVNSTMAVATSLSCGRVTGYSGSPATTTGTGIGVSSGSSGIALANFGERLFDVGSKTALLSIMGGSVLVFVLVM